jgi:C-terminal processing protease CtpA/Prc
VVGMPTAGVDALPTWVPLGSEHLLQLPGARLSLADGTSWGRVGVVPDVVVEAIDGPQHIPPPAPPVDLQIDAALRMVSSPASSPGP